ncbi:MAG: 50S ribosomal protein L6 [Spirochaetes bacterium]|nr:50S ribosomal protein L6 [Spirochaetota bacterium]
MSRIGKMPVAIPQGVKVTVQGFDVNVEGPKGKLSQKFNGSVTVKVSGSNVEIERKDDSRQSRAYHGLYRNLINNMVAGVTTGFTKALLINGVGYKAESRGEILVLSLGYSNDVFVGIPQGLKVTVEGNNQKIVVTGVDKHLVGQFASDVRKLRAPEPYKGKGIRYEGENVRKKVGKTGVK